MGILPLALIIVVVIVVIAVAARRAPAAGCPAGQSCRTAATCPTGQSCRSASAGCPVGLVCQVPQSAAVAVFALPGDWAFPAGDDLAGSPVTTASAADCGQACAANAACLAYTWDGPARACWLKGAAGAFAPKARQSSGLMGGRGPTRLAGPCLSFARYAGYGLEGGDLPHMPVTHDSEAGCQAACAAAPACVAYTWQPRGKHCWLKASAGGPKTVAGESTGVCLGR